MKQMKISSSLEAIVATTVFALRRDAITTSYRDRLAIELLTDRATFAYQLLEMLVGESGINIILRRVQRQISTCPIRELDMPDAHFKAVYDVISEEVATPCISTVHMLYFIASDSSTAISAELSNYGILSEDIDLALRRLTA